MRARVKDGLKNVLLALPLQAYVLRPGFIQPMRGVRSKTAVYRILYSALSPLMPSFRWTLPDRIITTEEVGRATLEIARRGDRSACWKRDML